MPREHLENVKVDNGGKNTQHDDHHQRQWFQNFQQKLGQTGTVLLNHDSNGERDDETKSTAGYVQIGHLDVTLVEYVLAQCEHPERHCSWKSEERG
jgi:hypothetical protein